MRDQRTYKYNNIFDSVQTTEEKSKIPNAFSKWRSCERYRMRAVRINNFSHHAENMRPC